MFWERYALIFWIFSGFLYFFHKIGKCSNFTETRIGLREKPYQIMQKSRKAKLPLLKEAEDVFYSPVMGSTLSAIFIISASDILLGVYSRT